MGWKNWSYLIKGGFIGASIGVIYLLLAWFQAIPIFTILLTISIMASCGSGETSSSVGLLGNCQWASKYFIMFIIVILTLIVFFGVGALIGWLVGKIKKK